MSAYDFVVDFESRDDDDATVERIYSVCQDVAVTGQAGAFSADFTRLAPDFLTAVSTAVEEIVGSGYVVKAVRKAE